MTHIKRPSKNHTRFLHHNAFLANCFARILGEAQGHGAVVDAGNFQDLVKPIFPGWRMKIMGFMVSLFLGRQPKKNGLFFGKGGEVISHVFECKFTFGSLFPILTIHLIGDFQPFTNM